MPPIVKPPLVPGVTQTGERTDPFEVFMEAMNTRSNRGVARDKITDAINLLLQAGDEDPMTRPVLGPVIALLTEGPSRRPPTKRETTGFTTPTSRRPDPL